jgi:hypothetical protein
MRIGLSFLTTENNMFDAQILIAPTIAIGQVFAIFSPWMSRGGDNATFSFEVFADTLTTGAVFKIQVYTKKSEDAGDGIGITAAKTYTAGTDGLGVFTFESRATDAVSMDDMVRYRFSIDDSVSAGEFVMFAMHGPAWYDSTISSTNP